MTEHTNKQVETCKFKARGEEKCNLATEMICNYKNCTLYVNENTVKVQPLSTVKKRHYTGGVVW